VHKSDVWSSKDGITWNLVTPGCKAPQRNLVADGNRQEGKHGIEKFACTKDSDCYGAEACDLNLLTCVCGMWNPRQQHAAASHGSFMYVSGGYASRLYSDWSNCGQYACGDTDASGYRFYLSDIWRSTDGASWMPVAFSGAYGGLGRGGHQMLPIPDPKGVPYLWVFGGRGGDNSGFNPNLTYYSDVWSAPLFADTPSVWTQRMGEGGEYNGDRTLGGTINSTGPMDPMLWPARTGHTVTLDPASADNNQVRINVEISVRVSSSILFKS
jgi:hypothetical protein